MSLHLRALAIRERSIYFYGFSIFLILGFGPRSARSSDVFLKSYCQQVLARESDHHLAELKKLSIYSTWPVAELQGLAERRATREIYEERFRIVQEQWGFLYGHLDPISRYFDRKLAKKKKEIRQRGKFDDAALEQAIEDCQIATSLRIRKYIDAQISGEFREHIRELSEYFPRGRGLRLDYFLSGSALASDQLPVVRYMYSFVQALEFIAALPFHRPMVSPDEQRALALLWATRTTGHSQELIDLDRTELVRLLALIQVDGHTPQEAIDAVAGHRRHRNSSFLERIDALRRESEVPKQPMALIERYLEFATQFRLPIYDGAVELVDTLFEHHQFSKP